MYLVFVESSYIMLLISLVFSGRIQRTLFDIIFKMYNVKAKSMHEMSSSDKIKTIFIRISVPFLVLIITFPFNVIPFLGTFLWIIVYSLLNAWSIQSLYFSFKVVFFYFFSFQFEYFFILHIFIIIFHLLNCYHHFHSIIIIINFIINIMIIIICYFLILIINNRKNQLQ